MTTERKYYIGDVGTEILVDTLNDISTATVRALLVKKPDGSRHEWFGTLSGTTKVRYLTVSGDFDQSGIYYLQSYVVLPGGSWKGRTGSFLVRKEFE